MTTTPWRTPKRTPPEDTLGRTPSLKPGVSSKCPLGVSSRGVLQDVLQRCPRGVIKDVLKGSPARCPPGVSSRVDLQVVLLGCPPRCPPGVSSGGVLTWCPPRVSPKVSSGCPPRWTSSPFYLFIENFTHSFNNFTSFLPSLVFPKVHFLTRRYLFNFCSSYSTIWYARDTTVSLDTQILMLSC
jgi:hypothetical protein